MRGSGTGDDPAAEGAAGRDGVGGGTGRFGTAVGESVGTGAGMEGAQAAIWRAQRGILVAGASAGHPLTGQRSASRLQ